MRYFTDNPLERMMMQLPKRPKPDIARQPPPVSRCRGCTGNKDTGCTGPCYRDLIITPRERQVER